MKTTLARLAAVSAFAFLASGCTTVRHLNLSAAVPAPAVAPTGIPVVIMPIDESFGQKASTQAYRADPRFIGATLDEFAIMYLIIPFKATYDKWMSDIPRTEITAKAIIGQLGARGIPVVGGVYDGSGRPQGLGADRMALAVRLTSYELVTKPKFMSLIIVTTFGTKEIVPKATLSCRVWRGPDGGPVYDGIITASCDNACVRQRGGAPRNMYSEVIAVAVDDCIEKSGLAKLQSRAVARGFADFMDQGQYVEAYRIASSPEQSMAALKELSRSASGRAIPEEARDLMARGKAAVSMAKSLGDYKTAVAAMEKSIAIAPWWASGHYNAALASEGAGQWAVGTRHLKAYLALKPDADDREAVRMKIAEFELHLERGDDSGAEGSPRGQPAVEDSVRRVFGN